MRKWVVTASACLVGLAQAAGLAEAAPDRETVRLEVLDTCVAEEWQKRDKTDRIADECKCVAARVAKDMPKGQVADFGDKLTRADRALYDAAAGACFKNRNVRIDRPS